MVGGLGLGGLPNVPDPTKIVGSGAEIAKAVATGGISVGIDIAEGFTRILFQTVEGGAKTVDQAVGNAIGIAKADIAAGKATVESVRRDVDHACSSVLSQVDQAIGGEIVRRFKAEIEKQLR